MGRQGRVANSHASQDTPLAGPGHRLVDRHPDKVKFVLMPKNHKDRDEYHSKLNLAPVTEPNALHLFTAGVKHKFDPSVPVPH